MIPVAAMYAQDSELGHPSHFTKLQKNANKSNTFRLTMIGAKTDVCFPRSIKPPPPAVQGIECRFSVQSAIIGKDSRRENRQCWRFGCRERPEPAPTIQLRAILRNRLYIGQFQWNGKLIQIAAATKARQVSVAYLRAVEAQCAADAGHTQPLNRVNPYGRAL